MELLSKPWLTLSTYISKHRYKNNDIQHYFDSFEIARSILHGLTTLHGSPYQRNGKLIHADIKPANLFILLKPKKRQFNVFRMPTYTDMIKIIDLGVSVGKGEDIWAYTPAYRPKGITQAEHGYDLYATAICFIELLTGKRPSHEQMGDKRRLRKIIKTNPSGSEYIDNLAINFATKCKNAATQKSITARSLISDLDRELFDKDPLRMLCLRTMASEIKTEDTKNGIVEILYPTAAKYWGWQRRSDNRIEIIKDLIDSLLEEEIILKGSSSKKYRISSKS